MGLITGFLKAVNVLNEKLPASDFIFYKIVNFNDKTNKYALQCINTKAIFHLNIKEIILDADILYGLHPVQSCFVGIEHAIEIKNKPNASINYGHKIKPYTVNRYGTYNLIYQDREKNLCFEDVYSKKTFSQDAIDIALTEHIISKFDAIQAFYVGLQAGLKMNKPVSILKNSKYCKPLFTIIK